MNNVDNKMLAFVLRVSDFGERRWEHMDWFGGLINMNGRVYDSKLRRFLSADKFVQDAGSTQNYNSYSYCLNNPLKYSDPSGWLVAPKTYSSWEWDENFNTNWATGRGWGENMGSGGGGAGGGGGNGTSSGPSTYDKESGTYRDANGNVVSWNSVLAYLKSSNAFSDTYIPIGENSWLHVNYASGNFEKLIDNGVSSSISGAFALNNSSSGEINAKIALEYSGTFEGVDVYVSTIGQLSNRAAVTLPGFGIIVNPNDRGNVDLLRHEFGHIIQADIWGLNYYYSVIAPASAFAANSANNGTLPYKYKEGWTEWSADLLSSLYFHESLDPASQGTYNQWNESLFPTMPSNTEAPWACPPGTNFTDFMIKIMRDYSRFFGY